MALLEQAPSRGTRAAALERVRASLGSLSPAERRVADRVLADPAQVIALSIGEFAALCEVAQPTVSRFSRNVGFASYVALRLGIAADFAADGTASSSGAADPLAALAANMRSDAAVSEVVEAVRLASRVEVWASPMLAAAADMLADRLAGFDIAASSAVAPERCVQRAKALPPGAVVILFGATDEQAWLNAVRAARAARARVVYVATRPGSQLLKLADLFMPLSEVASVEVVGPLMAQTLAEEVRAISWYAGPPGPASPWRVWPHQREVMLATGGDPIPALLLSPADPPTTRALVIFFSWIGAHKEYLAPPRGPWDKVTPHVVAGLLNAGYDVLLPDAPGHGARKRAWEDTQELFRAGLREEGPDYLEQIATETPDLIDAALGLGVVTSAAQIAVAGQSGGGMQSLLKFAADRRIGCGVAIMPICELADLAQFSDLSDRPRAITGGPSPRMANQLAPRPLLLIGGGEDKTAPASHIEAFHRGITPAYERAEASEQLKYVHLDDVAHTFDARQMDAMLDWLERHLRSPKPKPQARRRRAAKRA